MTEQKRSGVLVDLEAGERYHYVVEQGEKIFQGSALVDDGKKITDSDLELQRLFLQVVSPLNSKFPWRINRVEWSEEDVKRAREEGLITDPSYNANYEDPGGLHEHLTLSIEGGLILPGILKAHLRESESVNEEWAKRAISESEELDPHVLAAGGGFHDVGRLGTQIYGTEAAIGNSLLRRMGIREDLIAMMPSEAVMQTPLDRSMDETIRNLSAYKRSCRLLDEFAKRAGGTNRTLTLRDYYTREWDPFKWAASYYGRVPSGRPSDGYMRKEVDVYENERVTRKMTRFELHAINVFPYFIALDNWVRVVSDLTLEELSEMLSKKLSAGLVPLSK